MIYKHTPGPWRVSPSDDTVVIDARRNVVAAIDGDYNQPDTWPEMECNARLIAAAPELLEVLRYYAKTFCEGPDECCGKLSDDRCSGCKAFSAIAKAEGR